MTNADAELRALWTSMGVPVDRQNELIAEIEAKASPEYLAKLFDTSHLKERCPTCGALVETIFDHIDIDCEHP